MRDQGTIRYSPMLLNHFLVLLQHNLGLFVLNYDFIGRIFLVPLPLLLIFPLLHSSILHLLSLFSSLSFFFFIYI